MALKTDLLRSNDASEIASSTGEALPIRAGHGASGPAGGDGGDISLAGGDAGAGAAGAGGDGGEAAVTGRSGGAGTTIGGDGGDTPVTAGMGGAGVTAGGAGGRSLVTAGTGGAASAGPGGIGGNTFISAGHGGTGSTVGGLGGDAGTIAGFGGMGATGGDGGRADVAGGAGGTGSAGPGGGGGDANSLAGNGGMGTAAGGAGGTWSGGGGNGGSGTAGAGGFGGDAILLGGNAGASAVGGADGGDASIDGGTATGTGTAGAVNLGTTSASKVNLARSGIDTQRFGSVIVPETLTAIDLLLDRSHEIVAVSASGGNRIISLPTAIGIAGRRYSIIKTDSSANTVTIDPLGAQTINDAATKVLSLQFETVTIMSDGTNWFLLVDKTASAQAPMVFTWGNDNVSATANTTSLNLGSERNTASAIGSQPGGGTENQFRSPRAGIFRNMRVRHNSSAGNGNSVVYTLFINNASTLLTATLASGAIGDASNLINTAAVAAGDIIDMRAIKALSLGSGAVSAMVAVEFV